jgi:ankyrin repeat protein
MTPVKAALATHLRPSPLTPSAPLAGLVKYALIHGQPVNSVLNGVLPLHAAASSGNETVVRMLIEHGADVNSPR